MAEERANITSAFPAPPAYWESFTSENLSALQSHLESSSSTAPLATFNPLAPASNPIPAVDSLPTELKNLIPPPIPSSGAYRSFNTIHAVAIPHPARLPTPPSRQALLQLLKQILLKFLRINHILAIDPDNKYYAPTWDELESLFKQMHEGVNAWRPHQGRELLISMMEDQVKALKEETERCNGAVRKAKEVVEGLRKVAEDDQTAVNGGADGERTNTQDQERRKRAKDRRIWEAIEHMDGDVG